MQCYPSKSVQKEAIRSSSPSIIFCTNCTSDRPNLCLLETSNLAPYNRKGVNEKEGRKWQKCLVREGTTGGANRQWCAITCDSTAFYSIRFHLISRCAVESLIHHTLSTLISSHRTSSCLISSRLILSHLISSNLI